VKVASLVERVPETAFRRVVSTILRLVGP